jgi:hypothetical protein
VALDEERVARTRYGKEATAGRRPPVDLYVRM